MAPCASSPGTVRAHPPVGGEPPCRRNAHRRVFINRTPTDLSVTARRLADATRPCRRARECPRQGHFHDCRCGMKHDNARAADPVVQRSDAVSQPAPLDDALRRQLSRIPTSDLTTTLAGHGLNRMFMSGVGALKPGLPRMVGPAFTLRLIPARPRSGLVCVRQPRGRPAPARPGAVPARIRAGHRRAGRPVRRMRRRRVRRESVEDARMRRSGNRRGAS